MLKKAFAKFNALFLITVIVLCSAVISVSAAAYPAIGAVSNQNGADVYSQPGYILNGHDGRLDKNEPSEKLAHLTADERVKVIGEKCDGDGDLWYKINYGENFALEGYVFNSRLTLVGSYTEDTDFEAWLSEQRFPESYKDNLRNLHALYPSWVFYADHINLEWSDVVAAESTPGKKLVHKSWPESWRSLEQGAYDDSTGTWIEFDSGGWVSASKMVVEYYTDPRNFLDSKSIFMFSSHSFDEKYDTKQNLMTMLGGTFLDAALPSPPDNPDMTYADAIMNAAKASNVTPFAIASTILQEQGTGGIGGCISGTIEGYEGYFNFFNVGAAAGGGLNAVQNGLNYAKRQGWDTREKSITGGAQWYAAGYVSVGQNTYYYMDFDVIETGGIYNHQYATNIKDAVSKASFLAGAYSGVLDSSLVFHIPVYNNMPDVTRLPEDSGNNNNFLSALSVTGYTVYGFNKYNNEYELIVSADTQQIEITATAESALSAVSGTGVKALNIGDNEFTVTVTASSGEVRTYKLTVNRPSSDGESNNNYLSALSVTGYNLSDFDKNKTEYTLSVSAETEQIEITATAESALATVSGTGTKALNSGDNEFTVTVTAQSGAIRVYKLTVNRPSAMPEPTVNGSYNIGTHLTGVQFKTSVNTFISSLGVLNGTARVFDKNGTEKSADAVIVTGDAVNVYNSAGAEKYSYTVLIYGDVNGDGEVSIVDLAMIQAKILDLYNPTGVYLNAADISKDGDITIVDLAMAQAAILELYIIQQ